MPRPPQVLGRANRVAPRKPPPRVLDFVNSASEIALAFGAFYERSSRPLAEHERQAQVST
jgi:type I site-specific restriction-modification system R (restriction) subunit